MYLRYFLWNFVGRVSDVQDAGSVWLSVSDPERSAYVTPTGYGDYFPVQFYALPLLLGLFGLYWHYKRDWKMAFVFTALFLFLGVIATLQQNQQQPQPRERDYFYTGSFLVFCNWIGVGAVGLAELVRRRRKAGESDAVVGDEDEQAGGAGATGGVLALCLLAVPINMAVGGWRLHDRSGNWIPWDYSYNILQSCEKDAILFTNGDNDTFPLWYLQDVAGIRRDVRIVNLSLAQMGWYIWQLKHERPWGAKQVPIGIDDNLLRAPEDSQQGLHPEVAQAQNVTIDVPADVMKWATDGASATRSTMSWTLHGQPYGQNGEELFTVYHKVIRSIMETNKWQRPVYFSSTVGPDAWAGLEEYFRWEGMAYRVMPTKLRSSSGMEPIQPDIMTKCLMTTLRDDEYYTEPHYGFKFRGLNDPSVFFLEDHRRIPNGHYRSMYLAMATYALQDQKNPQLAVSVLNRLEQVVSPDLFGMPYWISARIADVYNQAGVANKAQEYARRTIATLDQLGEEAMNDQAARAYPPQLIRLQMLAVAGDYDAAIAQYQQLRAQYPDEPSLRRQEEELRIKKFLAKKDTAGARAEAQRLIVGYGRDTSQAAMENMAALRALVLLPAATEVAPPDNTAAQPSGDSGSTVPNTSTGSDGR
jgi:tetratricopeptide (TPR) repeat protein